MEECKCSLRIKLVGDGCEVCNPELALEHAKQAIEDLEEEAASMIILLSRAVEAARGRLITITNPEHDQVFNEIEEYLNGYE